MLDADAIKPWRYEGWLFPRDPQFAEKAGRVLDLYAGFWQGAPLGPGDPIISALPIGHWSRLGDALRAN